MSKQKETDEQIVSRACRGCYGWGDGICNYHRHKFDMAIKRAEKLNKQTVKRTARRTNNY